ncbi:MAG: hypothetical protein ACYCWW_03120 [Deltaproteobacteria bacterium]
MTRRALAILALALPSGIAWSAQVTHVATADSGDWVGQPEFDFNVGFVANQESAEITREQFQPQGGLIQASQLGYSRTTLIAPIRAAIGIWHHLELHLVLPVVISDSQSWDYSAAVKLAKAQGAVSTTQPEGLCPDGPMVNGECTGQDGSFPGYKPPAIANALPVTSDRGGFGGGIPLGNVTIGTAWAAMSEEDDDTDPTWVIGFDYTAPTAPVMNPTVVSYGPGQPGQVGAIGDGFHHFQPWSALSKRHGILDPYIEVYADIPHASGNVYDNCSSPYPGTSQPRDNCNTGPWNQATTQAQPVYVGGFWFGSEFVAFEDVEKEQKVSVDLRFITEYHSEARTYTELSDLLQALTYQQDFARLGAALNLYLRASRYLQVVLGASFAHDTDHWLTMENLGQPTGGQTQVTVRSPQQNPNFDFRWDNPGDRFMLVNSLIAQFNGSLQFSF